MITIHTYVFTVFPIHTFCEQGDNIKCEMMSSVNSSRGTSLAVGRISVDVEEWLNRKCLSFKSVEKVSAKF